jgi:hypothetical protein
MTTFLAKAISKKILGEKLENKFGKDVSKAQFRRRLVVESNLTTGSLFRASPSDETRWHPDRQVQEATKGPATWHFRARRPGFDQGQAEGVQAGHELVQLLRH